MKQSNLVDIIRDIAGQEYHSQTPTDLLFGTVTSVSPLRIKIDNRFEAGERFLILSALCRPLERETEEDGVDDEHYHKHKILVWRGLQAGDRVRMLECGHGQLFYVLDREGDYSDT